MRTARSWSHLLALSATLLVTPPAHAGWFAQGNPICRAPGAQTDVTVLADGAGGSYVVWRDERRGPGISDLYASRVDADGSLHAGWPVDGLALAQSGGVGRPWPVVTASGALMVEWLDTSTLTPRIQRVDGSGVRDAGYPVDGIALAITVGGPFGTHSRFVTDGAEGAYLLWNDFAGFTSRVRVTRLTASGALALGWAIDGLSVGGSSFQNGGWSSISMSADGNGGVWFSEALREDGGIGPDFLIGAQAHVHDDRSIDFFFLQPAGYVTGTPPEFQTHVTSVIEAPDGTGGDFVAWRLGGPLGPQLYVRHHPAVGTTAPPASAAPVDLQALSDGAGGVYLLGIPTSAVQLELHRRDAALATPAGWGSGVVLTTATSYQAIASVRSGSNVYVGWSNGAAGAEDLRASAVSDAAVRAPGYGAEGTVVSDAGGVQVLQSMAAGIAGDAYAGWVDTRSGEADVYLAHLGPDGPIQDALLEADLDVTPRDPERLAHGHWVKAWIEPHAPQTAASIDVASLRMNGSVPIDPAATPRFTDHDRDGVLELLVRFDRAAVAAAVPAGGPAIMTVTGTMAGLPFVAADTLLGGHHVVLSPEAGVRLNPGTVTRLAWQMPEGLRTARVALLASLNGGRSWEMIAPDVAAGEPLDWRAPSRPSDHVLLAVTMTGEGETADALMDGLLGMSPEIQIGTTLGVGDRGPVALAVRRSTPNPQSSRRVQVDLSLATSDDATVELLDVTGRVRVREDLTGLAAGAHVIDLAAHGALPPGLYFVRLTQGAQRAQARLTLVD